MTNCKKINSIAYIILLFLCQSSFGQLDTTNTYNSIKIKGVPTGKGISFDYEIQPNYTIKSKDNTNLIGNSKTKIKENARLTVKAKFPIINKPNLVIVGGVRYQFEEYHFENNTNLFYTGLEDKGLKTIGTDFTIIKPTKTKNYWILRIRGDFNGDYNSDFIRSEYLKFSISPLWGRKVNEDFTYAMGLSLNYRFGSPLILPVVSFNKNLNEKWDVESVVPVYFRFRYKNNQSLNWINAIELDGASYKISTLNSVFPESDNIHLHRSDIRYSTKIEIKLYKWIWLATEVGLNQNLTYNVTNSNRSRKNILLENTINPGFFFNFSVFISPSSSKK